MKDISKRLTVVNTDTRKPAPSGESTTQVVGGGSFGGISIGGGLDYLLKAIWDRVWEIKTDSQGNEYIFGKLPVVTQYGITMYADGGDLNLPSIYAGIPFDNKTIWFNPDTGKVEVIGGTGGGVADSVHWNNIEGKPLFSAVATSGKYADLSGLPDLSVYATTKYLTTELKKYVTLNTEQTIAAHKNFLNGLSVGGLPITKSQDDVIYLDANLVVRGGITMYATDAIDVPSIIDALPIASASAKGIAAFNPNDFSVVDGYVSFIGSAGSVDESVLADYAKKTDLNDYLPLSGGRVTGQIEYNFDKGYGACSLPAAGVLDTNLTFNNGAFNKYKSFLGNAHYTPNNSWYNVISVRADNSSELFGMYLVTSMTNSQDNLTWNRQGGYNGAWQGERVILDSVNWSQYVTAADGDNYLPLTGGTINGSLRVLSNVETGDIHTFKFLNYEHSPYGLVGCIYSSGAVSMQIQREANNTEIFNMLLQPNGGNVGINDPNPVYPLQVGGSAYIKGTVFSKMINFDSSNTGANSYAHARLGTFDRIGGMTLQFGKSNGDWFTRFSIIDQQWTIELFSVDKNGNVLSAGGITMYSDIRKKTKLQDVELSLRQIADAPLIEHYYNSDINKTTHVGSIAQYWAGLNDWFCKLDGEGYYTMEIQNAALASAISIARELVKYESKTDRKIRLLKQL